MEEYVDRYHVVKVCREYCINEGYSGDLFLECVKQCVARTNLPP